MNRKINWLNSEKTNPLARNNDPALACFLNALARENHSVQIEAQDGNFTFKLPLSEKRAIHVVLSYYSMLGSHEYHFPAWLISGSDRQTLSTNELIELIVSEPALCGITTEEQKKKFVDRVLESHTNTNQAVQLSPYKAKLFTNKLNFMTAEQGLLIGHSFHPAPKSREQFTLEDAKRYSPELGGKFQLYWLMVDVNLLSFGSSANVPFYERISDLVAHEPKLSETLVKAKSQNKTLLPVHPWQWEVMMNNPSIQEYLESARIKNLGQIGVTWYPTSSTRSLYAPSLPYMLKFSLSVKLTNSIRNLSLKEVIRGTRLNDLFQQQALVNELGTDSGFQIMQEPAYLGLLDCKGNIIDESLVAFRSNPLEKNPEQEAVVLATLTQQNPYSGSSLVANRICHYSDQQSVTISQAAERWFEAYCTHVIIPLFNLQANFGIVFLAHQQNIVMQLEEGFPVGMYYRDCQGTGYTDLAFKLFNDKIGEKQETLENYWNQDKVRRYFAYYLIINSTFNVISAICANLEVTETQLIQILHKKLSKLLHSGVQDDRCLRYVLSSETLCCKGNFYCYLQNFNENSIPDPAVIYFDLPNPLAQHTEMFTHA